MIDHEILMAEYLEDTRMHGYEQEWEKDGDNEPALDNMLPSAKT